MGYLRDSLRALAATIKQTTGPTATFEFPEVVRPRAERYKASFALLHGEDGDELCIGCLACERICPSRIISVTQVKKESPVTGKKRAYASDFTLDLTACIFCELCVQVCPPDAIIMTKVQEQPGFAREDLVLTMDKLYANEKQKPPAWANGTRLMAMQEPPKPEKKVEAAP